jgi:predicted RND superfamily exporter protein
MDRLYADKLGSVELALVERSLPDEVADVLIAPYYDPVEQQARLTVRAMETSKTLRRAQYLESLYAEILAETGLDETRVKFTGLLVLYNNVLQSLYASQILTLGAVFIAIGVMFLALFRSVSLALLGLAPNILAAGLVLGVMGLAGIPLDIMTITIAAIVVGMGVDNCIHYIHRFRKEFAVDQNYRDAMYRSHASIGRAMYYTTLTVVVGFSMLTLSNFTPSIYFGVLTVMAMLAAVMGALLLLPKLIITFKPLGPGAA